MPQAKKESFEDFELYVKFKSDLTDLICEYFEVTKEQYEERNKINPRKRPFVFINHVVRYILYLNGVNKNRIAALYNNDHTTVIHSIKLVEDYLDTYFKYKSLKQVIDKDKRVISICKRIKSKTRHLTKYNI